MRAAAPADIVVVHVAGDATLDTPSGHTQIASATGDVSIRNGSTGPRIGTVGGDLRVRAGHGRIEARSVQGSVDARTAHGAVVIGVAAGTDVDVKTSHGDLEVGIPHGHAVWLDLDTNGWVAQRLRAHSRRSAHEGHREVQAPAHAPGVGGGHPVGGLDQRERLEQLVGPGSAHRAGQVVQVGHEGEVLPAGEQVVHGGELARDADQPAYRVGLAHNVVAQQRPVPDVGLIRVDRMFTIVVLPAPLGPSRATASPWPTVRCSTSSTVASP